ncbi:FAD-dependent monooxygenase [Aureimonas sp. AU40]|uniref:FAD-dependent monooxygenase n=1 Tax=Aureimonas sp. AU40 TaxID=1637747 RepID=UPI0007863CDC|nr:FAD-dependent monooxygenase [Aureimonas sp. AU40]
MNTPDRDDRPLLIVGAGIAGLASALAFSKAGFRSVVCERSDRLDPVGAGLQLSANALSVLDRLGVLASLRENAFAARTVALRDGASDRLLARVPVESGADGYLAVHRADLQSVLLEAVQVDPRIELRLGRSLKAVETRPSGVRASFARSDGSSETIDTLLLVGADGVHSATAGLLSCPPPTDSGLVAHRFSLNDAPGDEIEAWLSPRSHAVSYPMRRSGERNLVLVERQGSEQTPSSDGWNPRLAGFIRHGTYLGRWPLLTVDPDERMRAFGRIVLVGDAAHAMFPFAAQGAAMALEDAWVLAASLATQADIDRAIGAYLDTRRPRIEQVLKRVRFHRFVYHLGWPASLVRNAAMALRSERAMRGDLAWLYDWRAAPLA